VALALDAYGAPARRTKHCAPRLWVDVVMGAVGWMF
jgi:hypothetical protein